MILQRSNSHPVICLDSCTQNEIVKPDEGKKPLAAGHLPSGLQEPCMVASIERGMMMTTPAKRKSSKPRCGLCGKTGNLTTTECCKNWICNDQDKYVLFSYARNSCSRNHERFTLCGYHHNEGHAGSWKACEECRTSFKTEMYVWYGTNDYNFEKLENPPAFEPTHCADCGVVINLGEDGYSVLGDVYKCEKCAEKELNRKMRRPRKPGSSQTGAC